MIPLNMEPGQDQVAAQVIARPDQSQTPDLSSWDCLLTPKAIHLRLMPHCDASCDFCETVSVKQGVKEKEAPLSAELWQRIKDAWLPDVSGVEVAGLGEPTLSKLWGTVARDTLAAGKVLYAPTNGHWLDQPFVYEPLGDGANVRLSISLDAGTAETYQRIGRGKDLAQWEQTLAAIRAFRQKCPNAALHSQFTATVQNIDDLPAWMETCAALGIKESLMRFAMMHTVSREDNSLRFAMDRTEAAIEAARAVAEREGLSFTAERRPYSEVQPNALAEPDSGSAVARLKRYLDLSPMTTIVCGPPVTTASGVGPGTLSLTTTSGIAPLSFGQPEIVRSVLTPRSDLAMEAMSTDAPVQPLSYIDASPVIWSDGGITTCFSKHVVGNAWEDTLGTLIRNPRYQAFLQRRNGAGGGALAEEFCFNCPRVF